MTRSRVLQIDRTYETCIDLNPAIDQQLEVEPASNHPLALLQASAKPLNDSAYVPPRC